MKKVWGYRTRRFTLIVGTLCFCALLLSWKVYFTYYFAGGPLQLSGLEPGQTVPIMKLIAVEVDWEAIGAFLGMAVAGLAVLLGLIAQTRQEQIETYVSLEMASIELFRWECENERIVRSYWDASDTVPEQGQSEEFSFEDFARQEYVCQILNLYEMCLRLYTEGIVPGEVIGSWVIWMWEFTEPKHFDTTWEKVASNYVGLLRRTMDVGQALRREIDSRQVSESCLTEEDAKRQFYAFMGGLLECRDVACWPVMQRNCPSFAQARGGDGRLLWHALRDRQRRKVLPWTT